MLELVLQQYEGIGSHVGVKQRAVPIISFAAVEHQPIAHRGQRLSGAWEKLREPDLRANVALLSVGAFAPFDHLGPGELIVEEISENSRSSRRATSSTRSQRLRHTSSLARSPNRPWPASPGRAGRAREPKSWRLLFISSGEIHLEAKLAEGKGKARAGQLLRMLDIPADRGLGFGVFDSGGSEGDASALARAIKSAASEAYGAAGPEFVRRILAECVTGDDVRAMIAGFVRDECPAGADGQVERVAHRLGLFAAAGELATAFGLTGWREGEARKAAAWALKAWLGNRGGMEPAEVRAVIEQVRLYFEQHGDSRFDPLDNPGAKPSPNRAGWRKGEGEDREWLIPPETWKSEICAGHDAVFVARTLYERGMLERVSGSFQSVRKISGQNTRVYVVNARILAGGDHVA